MLQFFFSPLGRITKSEFTLGWLFWLCVELACFFGLWAAEPQSAAGFNWFLAMTAAAGLSTVSVVLLGLKRLRDAGFPVWLAFVLLIPGISLIALIVMSNLPSQNGTLDFE